MEELIGQIIGIFLGALAGGVGLALVFKFFQDDYAKALAGFLVRVKHYMGVIGPKTQEKPTGAHREGPVKPSDVTPAMWEKVQRTAALYYGQNMTQAKVAEEIGVTERTVWNHIQVWERAEKADYGKTTGKLREFYGKITGKLRDLF
jgi:hypothetical protein